MKAQTTPVLLALALMTPAFQTTAGQIPAQPAGKVNFEPEGKARFDFATANPSSADQAFMREHYTRMSVSSPYFDSRLSWFPNAWAYVDVYAMHPGDPTLEQKDWVMRDASGNKLYIPFDCNGSTCTQFAGNFANPAFRRQRINEIAATVSKGYKGVWVDDVNMPFRVGNGAQEIVIPIDTNTGQPMTLDAWQSYMTQFVEELRAAIPSVEIAHNIIWYTDPVESTNGFINREIDAADIINLERGGTDAGLTNGGGRFGYETFLSFVDKIHGRGRSVALMEETNEIEYGLATYFLISQGRDLMGNVFPDTFAPGRFYPGYSANLGDALGQRVVENGLLRRDFSCGTVVLNQVGGAFKTFNGNGYTRLDGSPAGTVQLGGKQAAVLLKPCGSTTPTGNSAPAPAAPTATPVPTPRPTAAPTATPTPTPEPTPVPTAAPAQPVVVPVEPVIPPVQSAPNPVVTDTPATTEPPVVTVTETPTTTETPKTTETPTSEPTQAPVVEDVTPTPQEPGDDAPKGTTPQSFQQGLDGFKGARDTVLVNVSPDKPYGSSKRLGSCDSSRLHAAALLKWNLTSVPTDTSIEGAELTLNVTDTSSDKFKVLEVKRDWTESKATWNQYGDKKSWQQSGGEGEDDRGDAVLGEVKATEGGSVTVKLNDKGVELVQSWIKDPTTNHGLAVVGEDGKDTVVFSSRESRTMEQRPKLTIFKK